MEIRPISIGDTVLISIGSDLIKSSIVNIEDSVIYFNNQGTLSLIVYNGKDWNVHGLDKEHTVVFEAGTKSSELPPDMMSQILFSFNCEEIDKICNTSNVYKIYCDNDDFWRLKIVNDHPKFGNITPVLVGYKTYRDMYRKLFSGVLDTKKANEEAGAGNLVVLQWMSQLSPPILPTRQGAINAAAGGYDNVLEWMGKLTPPVYMISDEGIKEAVEGGHINILRKIITSEIKAETSSCSLLVPQPMYMRRGEHQFVYPYDYYIEYAAKSGRIDVLEWLRGIGCDISNMFEPAVEEGRLDILQWSETLYPPLLPNRSIMNMATIPGRLAVLVWLEKVGILPNKTTANLAAINLNIPALEWLKERDIFPDYKTSNTLVETRTNVLRSSFGEHLKVLKLLSLLKLLLFIYCYYLLIDFVRVTLGVY